jgi:hypothetical protein
MSGFDSTVPYSTDRPLRLYRLPEDVASRREEVGVGGSTITPVCSTSSAGINPSCKILVMTLWSCCGAMIVFWRSGIFAGSSRATIPVLYAFVPLESAEFAHQHNSCSKVLSNALLNRRDWIA